MKKINSNLIYNARKQGLHIDTRSRIIQIKDSERDKLENRYVKRLCKENEFTPLIVIEYNIDRRVFVSGEPSKVEKCEYNRFAIAENNLRNSNYHPVIPFKLHNCDNVPSLKDEIKMLLDCECIYFLPGWTKSEKCRMEFAIALSLGIEILNMPIE